MTSYYSSGSAVTTHRVLSVPSKGLGRGVGTGESGQSLLTQSFYDAAKRRRNRDLRDRLRALPNSSSIVDAVVEHGESWDAIGFSMALHAVACKYREESGEYPHKDVTQDQRWSSLREVLLAKLGDGEARNLANNAWSLAVMACKDYPLLGDLSSYVQLAASSFKQQEVSNTCWAFATLKWYDMPLFDCLATEAIGKSATASCQDVTNTAWAFSAILCMHVPLFEVLSECVNEQAAEFKPQELANAMWAMALVAFKDTASIFHITRQTLNTCAQFTTQNLANFIWAYAKLSYSDEEVICRIKAEAFRKLGRFSAQDLVSSSWALATMAHRDESFLDECILKLQVQSRTRTMQPQHASNMLWSLATVSYVAEPLFSFLCASAIARINEFKPQEAANSIWSLATALLLHESLVLHMSCQVLQTLEAISTQSLANFVWAYAKLGKNQDAVIQGLQSEALRKIIRFSEQDLSTTVWAFSTMLHRDDGFLKQWVSAVQDRMGVQALKPQHASNVLWALATVAFYDATLFATAVTHVEAQLHLFRPQDLSCVIWSCATITHSDQRFIDSVASEVLSRVLDFDPQSIGNTAWALSQLATTVNTVYEIIWQQVMNDKYLRSCNDKVLSMVAGALFKGDQADLSWKLFDRVVSVGIDPGINTIGIWLHWCRQQCPDVVREIQVLRCLAKFQHCRSLVASLLTAASLRLEECGELRSALELVMVIKAHDAGNAVTQLLFERLSNSAPHDKCDSNLCFADCYIPRELHENKRRIYDKESQLLQHVLATASRGDPESIIKSIESFSVDGNGWLKIAGDAKGAVLDELILNLAPSSPQLVVEFGCYVGYSACRMGRLLRRWGGHLISVEVDPVHACVARNVVEYAGLTSHVSIYVGYSEDAIPHLASTCRGLSFDAIFMDQRGTRFHIDLQALEAHGLLSDGCAVAADNVLKPGAPYFLWYLQTSSKYDLTVVSLQEFASESVEDWISIAHYRPMRATKDDVGAEPPESLGQIAFLTDRARKWSCAADGHTEFGEQEWSRHSQQIREAYVAAGIRPRIVRVLRQKDGKPFVNW